MFRHTNRMCNTPSIVSPNGYYCCFKDVELSAPVHKWQHKYSNNEPNKLIDSILMHTIFKNKYFSFRFGIVNIAKIFVVRIIYIESVHNTTDFCCWEVESFCRGKNYLYCLLCRTGQVLDLLQSTSIWPEGERSFVEIAARCDR